MNRLLAFLVFLVSLSASAAGQYARFPVASGGVTTYPSLGDLPGTAADGATAVTLDTHGFYIYDLGSLAWVLQTASTITGVAGPGASVNNELVLWNGAGGNNVKRGTGTGVVNVIAGVVNVGDVPTANVPWATPGTIGSGTPNTGAFTTVTATGRFIGTESADFTTGGFLFSESGTDTGWTSPSDGVMYQYGNSSIGSKWDSNGISEMRGVPMLFPNVTGSAGQVLTTDGAGVLSWTTNTSGTTSTIAGFNEGTGLLETVPNLTFQATNAYAVQHNQNTFDPPNASGAYFLNWGDAINPTGNRTGVNYGSAQFSLGLGTDDGGFSYDATGGGGITGINGYIDGAHKMSWDTATISSLNLGANFGNGVDVQIGDRYRGIFVNTTATANTTVANVNMYQAGWSGSSGAIGSYNALLDTLQTSASSGYSGLTMNGAYGVVSGGVDAITFNPNGTSISNNFRLLNTSGNWTNIGGAILLDDGLNITGTQSNNYMGLSQHPHIATSHGYFGINETPHIDNLTGGGDMFVFNASPQIDASDKNVYLFNCNTSLITTSGDKKCLTGSGNIDVNGKLNVGVDNVPMVDGGGNPSPYHNIGGTFTAAAASTTANVDKFMFSPLMNISMGAGATATSGPLAAGLAAEGFIVLNDIGAGASLDNAGGQFNAFVGSAGSGTIAHGYGYRAVTANFGSTITLTDYKALVYEEPFGPWATTSWGLYVKPATAYNWLAGSLKIGGTAGSTDQAVSGAALEIEGGLLKLPVQAAASTPTCAAAADDGKLAITSAHILCICDGAAWNNASDGVTACTF